MTDNLPSPNHGNFLFYNTEDGVTRVRLLVENHTVWMPQKAIAELFETTVPNVNIHINNILEEGELEGDSVIKDYLITAADGKNYKTKHYNLDMILAIGYRVRSPRGTQFRRFATQTLREFLLKGFILDDERLKSAETTFGQDYFDELLERIRDIRASERRFYQKITDIYATSIDYNPNSPTAQTFFATVQNKLEWAITGMTAPEIIKQRANANQPNMGLTTWKNRPDGPIRKNDVTVAKNYLNEKEIASLNRIVTMYLDYAELQAERNQSMTMNQWIDKLNEFLQFNDYDVLNNAGQVQRKVAEKLALDHFTQYQQQQLKNTNTNSDFDQFIEDLKHTKQDRDQTTDQD